MKKLWLLLILLCLACPAMAGETVYTCGDYRYTLLEDGTAAIAGYKGSANKLTIPAEVDGYRVSAIGDRAFSHCYNLTSISIPDNLKSIGLNPFRFCSKLTSIYVSPDHSFFSVVDGVLIDQQNQKLICYPCSLPDTEYSIPDSVTSIGDEAFADCSNLSSISIPDSVTSIGNAAFFRCDNLTSISIPDSVTSIGDEAFADCSNLSSISIPDSVTSIGNVAFADCSNLTTISIPDNLKSIGLNPLICCSKLTSICVSPDHSFFSVVDGVLIDQQNQKLICYPCSLPDTEYSIPDSVTSIGDGAFTSCYNLTSISIPDSVTSIGNVAFADCSNLSSISIPDSVTSIGDGAFYDCNNLTLRIPRNSWLVQWCRDNKLSFKYADEWNCPQCATLNNRNFCTECGTSKPVFKEKCERCGFDFRGDMPKFCPECGQKQ